VLFFGPLSAPFAINIDSGPCGRYYARDAAPPSDRAGAASVPRTHPIIRFFLAVRPRAGGIPGVRACGSRAHHTGAPFHQSDSRSAPHVAIRFPPQGVDVSRRDPHPRRRLQPESYGSRSDAGRGAVGSELRNVCGCAGLNLTGSCGEKNRRAQAGVLLFFIALLIHS
jgi:hypothetical protein